MTEKKAAFTLIELLIVVAIIAILAAIAVPNFLEAQVRSKVSRVKSDMRSMATGIESYAVDQGQYPSRKAAVTNLGVSPDLSYTAFTLNLITTPIAYLTSIPLDPFGAKYSYPGQWSQTRAYHYYQSEDGAIDNPGAGEGKEVVRCWGLDSYGPDQDYDSAHWIFEFWGLGYPIDQVLSGQNTGLDGINKRNIDRIYDPTNGTVSDGDLLRISNNPLGSVFGGAGGS
jgi:type II secretion system protein G